MGNSVDYIEQKYVSFQWMMVFGICFFLGMLLIRYFMSGTLDWATYGSLLVAHLIISPIMYYVLNKKSWSPMLLPKFALFVLINSVPMGLVSLAILFFLR